MQPAAEINVQSQASTEVLLHPYVTVEPRHKEISGAFLFAKRVFDILSSLALLLLVWPVFIVIAILIKREDNGPIFYRHKRIGMNGNEIRLWKFRTMVQNADRIQLTPEQQEEWQKNFKLQNDPRVTRVGQVLRNTSLDELPQLLNIIGGSMSVIGPRPIVEKELAFYGIYQERFLSAKPGLTGYWQAYGRSNVGYEKGERQAMEMYYINNAGFILDIRILLQSFLAVLKRDGAV